jgi:hypothetical protein
LTEKLAGRFNWLTTFSLSRDYLYTRIEIVALSETDVANCAANAN